MIPLPDQPLSAEGIYLLMFRPILTGLVFNEIFEQVFWHPRSASRPAPIWRLTQTFLKRRRSNVVNNSLAIKKSQHPISVNWPWLYVKHQPFILSFYPFSVFTSHISDIALSLNLAMWYSQDIYF